MMIRSSIAFAAAAAAFAAALVPGATALATTVPSSIGSVTAEQYHGNYCDDFGADIEIAVAAGLPSTTYTATYTAFVLSGSTHYEVHSATFTTNAAGDGSLVKLNTLTTTGGISGPSVATVTAAGTTVTVEFPIHCTSNQGD